MFISRETFRDMHWEKNVLIHFELKWKSNWDEFRLKSEISILIELKWENDFWENEN